MGLLKSNLITLAGGVSVPTGDPTLKLDLEFSSMSALPASITFTRSSTASYFDKDGVMQTALANAARFDHDPVTLEPLGLLIEETRTNSLLNSAAPVTQNVTVTAASWTLSFYGTGSVAMSGAYVGTVNGAGAYPARRYMTFTPTAGTLTLTPTGNVEKFQLELGKDATSYIPTTSVPVARAQDVAQMTGVNFSSWFDAISAGTINVRGIYNAQAANTSQYSFDIRLDAQNVQALSFYTAVVTYVTGSSVGVVQPALNLGNKSLGVPINTAWSYSSTQRRGSQNGGAIVSGAYALPTPPVQCTFGGAAGNASGACTLASVKIWNVAKTDAELIEFTTP